MTVAGFDHVAIPIENVDVMLDFYAALGFRVERQPPVYSVHFGANKINMHAPRLWKSGKFTLRGPHAAPGCGDFCFVWSGGLAALTECLENLGIVVEEGPVERVGGAQDGSAVGTSVYIRDPDDNLLEFIVYAG